MEGAVRVVRPLQKVIPRARNLNNGAQVYRFPLRANSTRRRGARKPSDDMAAPRASSCHSRMNSTLDKRLLASGILDTKDEPIEVQLVWGVHQRHLMQQQISRQLAPANTSKSTNSRDSYYTFHSFSDGTCYDERHYINPLKPQTLDWNILPAEFRDTFKTPQEIAKAEIYKSATSTAEPTLDLDQLSPELRAVFEPNSPGSIVPASDSEVGSPSPSLTPSKKFLKKQLRIAQNKEIRKASRELQKQPLAEKTQSAPPAMTSNPPPDPTPAQHKPLVVGRTKPPAKPQPGVADTNAPETKAALNHEIEENIKFNTASAAPADGAANPPTKKKEKATKQPKPPKAAPPTAPLSPAIIDLRVGHILRAINHPNADSLYVSTIAMGDPEGADHTQVDEETGKVVRTVCSGLNGLVPLAEMQDRKVVVVANLKPVNMRSIKSAAMVLAASPPAEEGADPHAADRVVELVTPPEGAEAGEPVYFEGWEYGEGKGPEKQLNPKKKQWEAIQPGFYTTDELVVGFNAGKSEVEGETKGDLVVKGKGKCSVKTLKGAVVR